MFNSFEIKLEELWKRANELQNLVSIIIKDYKGKQPEEYPNDINSNVLLQDEKLVGHHSNIKSERDEEIFASAEESSLSENEGKQLCEYLVNQELNPENLSFTEEERSDVHSKTRRSWGNIKQPIEEGNCQPAGTKNNYLKRVSPEGSEEGNKIENEESDINNLDNLNKVLKSRFPPEPDSQYNRIIYERHIKYSSNYNKTPKYKNKNIISKLSTEEKDLILYDRMQMGIRKTERKFGIYYHYLREFENKYKSSIEREAWMSIQKAKIEDKMRMLEDGGDVVDRVKGVLGKNIYNNIYITLDELCTLSFDRGIAVVAVNYGINLLELQFLLLYLCPGEWAHMETMNWYSLFPNHKTIRKIEIARLSESEGNLYAAKKCGKDVTTISKFRRLLKLGKL